MAQVCIDLGPIKQYKIKKYLHVYKHVANIYIFLFDSRFTGDTADCSYLNDMCSVPANFMCNNEATCSCDDGIAKCWCFNGYSGENCEIPPGMAIHHG